MQRKNFHVNKLLWTRETGFYCPSSSMIFMLEVLLLLLLFLEIFFTEKFANHMKILLNIRKVYSIIKNKERKNK